MNILGIGPLELVLFVLIALVVLGPNDIVKVSKNLGNWIKKIRKSDTWENVIKMTDEVKKIPQNLIEESGIDEIKKDLTKAGSEIKREFVDIEELNRELNRYKAESENELKLGNIKKNISIKTESEE
jgi:Sec-independent protein translocase protein TatA